MRIFRRYRRQSSTGLKQDQWTDKAAGKIARLIMFVQTRFAVVMNRIVSKMSRRNLKIAVVCFCLLSWGFSVYTAMAPIFFLKNEVIDTGRIRIPEYANKGNNQAGIETTTISEDVYKNIQRYKHYMDSTSQAIRTGLLDSIKVIEEIYHSQKPK